MLQATGRVLDCEHTPFVPSMEWELREVSDVFPSWVLLTSNLFARGLRVLFPADSKVSCFTNSSLIRLKNEDESESVGQCNPNVTTKSNWSYEDKVVACRGNVIK